MAQRQVSAGEIIRAAWQAEDAWRERHVWIHPIRKLPDGRRVALGSFRKTRILIVSDEAGDDIYDYVEGDSAWAAALGWDGNGRPYGYTHQRRRGPYPQRRAS